MEQDKIKGLTSQEAEKLKQEKKVNYLNNKITKSVFRIIFDNTFTLFNGINFLIAILLITVKSWSNLFFIVIILLNLFIAIFQELHAKRLVDKLSLMNVSKVSVIRDTEETILPVTEIVLNDVIILKAGEQVPCDCKILNGHLELNESMLTGEVDSIFHYENDEILSGTTVISGIAYCQVIHVGQDNYSYKLAKEAKALKKVNSELLKSMKKVTFFTTILIIPLGIALFLEGYFLRNQGFNIVIPTASGALLGMLPKGIVFLMSISLFSGVIALSKKKILVQDIYSLETLARTDVLCLDKTGTITDGNMKVIKKIKLGDFDEIEAEKYIQSFLYHSEDNNQTFQALKEYFNKKDYYQADSKVAFSSKRKYSAINFKEKSIVFGAFDKLLNNEKVNSFKKYLNEGYRLIAVGYSKTEITYSTQNIEFIPYYLLIIEDNIRENINEAIKYFQDEELEVKIISGDNPISVSAIASKVGINNSDKYIDMSTLEEDADLNEIVTKYSIFARVSPYQKRQIVQALHSNNKKVAMTGDGVNDLLALKEADISISLTSASDAAKQISQIVLLDDNFINLPDVLLQGRRVVNNVTRSAQVFFIKTVYSMLLSFICLALNMDFPFLPIMITFMDCVFEAFPSFLTIFDPSYYKVKTKFLPSVLKTSIPNGLAIAIVFLIVVLLNKVINIDFEQVVTILYLVLAVVTAKSVISSSRPFTKWRIAIVVVMCVGFPIGVFVPFFRDILHIAPFVSSREVISMLIFATLFALIISIVLCELMKYLYTKRKFVKLFHLE